MATTVLRHVLGQQGRAQHESRRISARSLSPDMRCLFHVMWQMGYGTIRGVHFRDGDLLDNPSYHAIRTARTTEDPWPHLKSALTDFLLKREHIRFIEELAATGTGVVDIKVLNGLPVNLEIHKRP